MFGNKYCICVFFFAMSVCLPIKTFKELGSKVRFPAEHISYAKRCNVIQLLFVHIAAMTGFMAPPLHQFDDNHAAFCGQTNN